MKKGYKVLLILIVACILLLLVGCLNTKEETPTIKTLDVDDAITIETLEIKRSYVNNIFTNYEYQTDVFCYDDESIDLITYQIFDNYCLIKVSKGIYTTTYVYSNYTCIKIA